MGVSVKRSKRIVRISQTEYPLPLDMSETEINRCVTELKKLVAEKLELVEGTFVIISNRLEYEEKTNDVILTLEIEETNLGDV